MVLILDNPVYSASDIGIACLGQSSRCYFHFRSKSSSPLPFLGAEPVQIHWPFGENKHLHLASAIKLGRKRRLDHSDREATFPTVRINRIVISKQNCHPPLLFSVLGDLDGRKRGKEKRNGKESEVWFWKGSIESKAYG